MSAVAAAVVGSAVIGGVVSSKAASKAATAQTQAADAAAAEQRAAREQLRTILAPYTASGLPALQAQMNLLGLGPSRVDWAAYARSNPAIMRAYEAQRTPPPSPAFGAVPPSMTGGLIGGGITGFNREDLSTLGEQMPQMTGVDQYGTPIFETGPAMQYGMPQTGGIQSLEDFAQNYYQTTGIGAGDDISRFTVNPQQEAVAQIEGSPMFQALARQGEEAILQNASATGGLRGGNVQAALGQFRPALLNQFIEQQYNRLGNMARVGQASATGVGAAGTEAATNIGNLLTQSGRAQAGSALAQGNAINQALGSVTGFVTSDAGKAALGKIF